MRFSVTPVILCLLLAIQAEIGAQNSPRLLPFQGRVADAQGASVPDGARVIRLRISESPVDNTFKWAGELHRATVNGGLINVVLGSKTPLEGVDFGKQLFLEVTVDSNNDGAVTEADAPMLPRQAILPVLFAHEAENSRRFGGMQLNDVRQLFTPPGMISAFAGERIPDGWLPCDGSLRNINDHPELFAAIGERWGSKTSSGFRLPDLRGVFLRGVSGSRTDGWEDPGDGRGGLYGSAATQGVGSFQKDETGRHSHTIRRAQPGSLQGGLPNRIVADNFAAGINDDVGSVINPSGGSETRPKNAAVNYIIKY